MTKWMRRIGLVLGGVFALLLIAVATIWGVSSARFNRTLSVPAESVAIATDSATLAKGRHLATAIGKCVECHGDRLEGKIMIDAPIFGRFVAPNLTSGTGGLGSQLSPERLERVLRHGVKRDGKPLKFMPSEQFQHFSDEDIAALISYVKSVPPVDQEMAPTMVGPIGRMLFVSGKFLLLSADMIPPNATHPKTSPPPGPTVEYGAYLTTVGGCKGCHNQSFSGGQVPGTPPEFKPAANITPTGIGHYTEADFFRALREGKRPGGTPIDSFMPYKLTKEMTDDEIRAVYAYLKTVPPKKFGEK